MTAVKGGAVQSVPGTEQNTRSVRLYRASPSYMTINDATQTGLDPYNDFSGIASCRHPSLPGTGEFHTIFSKWGTASADKHYLWCVVESGGSHYLEFRFQDANNDFYSAVSAAISPTANVWSRYAFAIEDPGGAGGTPYNVYFWENGTLLGGAPVTSGDITYQLLNTGTAPFQIGGSQAGGEYFDGNIDDVHFWGQGKVLSTASVQAWLATQATGQEGMAGYWPMNAAYGTDLSPNGNNLSSVNVSPAVHSPYASFSHIVTEADDWDALPEAERYSGKHATLVITGSARDESPPYITNMTPTPGVIPGTRSAAKSTPIEFDVVDDSPGLRIALISIRLAGDSREYVVHNGSDFVYPFDSDDSLRTAIASGYHFKVLPRDGWTSNIEQMWIYALDAHGNLEGGLP